MAQALSEKVISNNNFYVGRQIFDVVTSGMYDNPLIVYREYIQNAVDSIDRSSGTSVDDYKIEVKLNGFERSITIIDNGLGVANQDVPSVLLSIGASNKEGTEQRGFRGIGRLGGLGYCKKLRFETRSHKDEDVAIVEWDRTLFENIDDVEGGQISLEETINIVSSVNFRAPLDSDQNSFFKVVMVDVERFHRDEILNLKQVRDYLSQVAPVSYDSDMFSFADEINRNLEGRVSNKAYNIFLNGERISRPYSDKIYNAKGLADTISGVEFFEFLGADGSTICHGWYAKTNYQSSMPPSVKMRGIRVRQGNIEVGNEYSLAHCFSEARFATWHIGEMFVVGNSLKPNARRDWFENTPNFEKFLEQFTFLGKQLSLHCRNSSKNRGVVTKINNRIERIKENFEDDILFIDETHFTSFREAAVRDLGYYVDKYSHLLEEESQRQMVALRDGLGNGGIIPSYLSDYVDGRKLRAGKKDILLGLISGIKERYEKTNCVNSLISEILNSFAKDGYSKEIKIANI